MQIDYLNRLFIDYLNSLQKLYFLSSNLIFKPLNSLFQIIFYNL